MGERWPRNPGTKCGSYRLYTPELLDVLKRIKYLRDVKKLNVPGIKEALGSKVGAEQSTPAPKPTPDLGNKLRRLRRKKRVNYHRQAVLIDSAILKATPVPRDGPDLSLDRCRPLLRHPNSLW